MFHMKWMASAQSILTFPLRFALSLFNEAPVQVCATSRASCKFGSIMVRAMVPGALLVNCEAHGAQSNAPMRQ